MARTRSNPKRVKIHYSYSVDEIAALLGSHKNTVRTWLKSDLQTIDDRRPALVQGRVLRAFLEAKRTSHRRSCPPGTLYCFKCRCPRSPALGMVDFVPLGPSFGHLCALCSHCGTVMHRRANLARIEAVMPKIEVRFTGAGTRIGECSEPSLDCDSKREPDHHG